MTIVAQAYEQHSGRQLLAYGQSNNETGLIVRVPNIFLMYTTQVFIYYNNNRNHTELSVDEGDWNHVSGNDCNSLPVNSSFSKSVYIFVC